MTFMRQTTGGLVTFDVKADHTFVAAPTAHECPGCHAMMYFSIVRNGQTRCIGCDVLECAEGRTS